MKVAATTRKLLPLRCNNVSHVLRRRLTLNTTPPFDVRSLSVLKRKNSGERTALVRTCFGAAASPNGESIRENEVRLLLQVIEHLMAVGFAVLPTRDVNPVAAHTETLEKVLATYHYTPHTAKLLMSDVAYLSDVLDKMGDLVEGVLKYQYIRCCQIQIVALFNLHLGRPCICGQVPRWNGLLPHTARSQDPISSREPRCRHMSQQDNGLSHPLLCVCR